MSTIPPLGQPLSPDNLSFLAAVAKSCRRTIIEMLKQSQSGHPGGSLSCIDYLTLLYCYILSQSGEKIIVSNGHISPGVYSILAALNYIPRDEVINTFRQVGSIYEGHVTRHIPGVFYGTGPLGIGVSAAAGFAHAEKLQGSTNKVYALMGDGEAQEGQVYEMMHYASKYQLDNLILFIDYNEVQLTDSLENIMPLNLSATFKAANWNVIEVDGHNYENLWEALKQAHTSSNPTVLIARTIMGKGVEFMEDDGREKKATWHGKAASPEDSDKILEQLTLSSEETEQLDQLKKTTAWHPSKPEFIESLMPMPEVNTGQPITYPVEEKIDCRSAYGKALLDLAKHNKNILALTADLRGSVMTKFVASELPDQHLEVGIAEQHMVSLAGGLSLNGFIPFCSTFGAFMSSRAKDQARVNDINQTNVKMVATHCGLSVGEDGPTHQAIDDSSSFLGLFHTMVIEPACPNQTDRIIRYIASHYGNFYVRMGRHKFPIITKEDGTPFYNENYTYEYGKCDVIRPGSDLTIVATGALVHEALTAWEELKTSHPDLSIEIIATTSIKQFDQALFDSIRKTKNIITAEDHNNVVGLSSQLAKKLVQQGIQPQTFETIAVTEYQFSGKAPDLYKHAGISSHNLVKTCLKILQK